MATTPRTIRFDDDVYKDMMGIAKRPLTASYHIQEACRQYLKQFDKPVVTSKNVPLVNKVDEDQFEEVWIAYGKKGNKKTSKVKYTKLSLDAKVAIYWHLPKYVESTPNKKFRKNFETYINQECWNDEVTPNAENRQANQPKQSLSERTADQAAAVWAECEAEEANQRTMDANGSAVPAQVEFARGGDSR